MNPLKRFFSHRFTFMVVPHGASQPKQFNLPLSIILLLFFTWTGITIWGSYLSARHIDYWRAHLTNHVLKLKVKYLVNQLDKSRGFFDEVKQIEAKLREYLQHKNVSDILHKEGSAPPATGGPTLGDQKDLAHFLAHRSPDFTWPRLIEKVRALNSEAQTRISSYDELSLWIDKQRRLFRATPRGWPCPGRRTSHFGKRVDPFSALEEFHFGVDIAGPPGTAIRSTADGTVRIASWQSGYGNLVVIQHDFGYSTRYAHNNHILVRIGDKVKRGQMIALMGRTGKSSGIHCHYEVRRYSKPKNPYAYMTGKTFKTGPLSRVPKPAKPIF